ncbi:hypothetical protein PILCRDRAFT_812786 [Piloderma croceum F 1598]|uniref:Piwi domain-containing protein n=1 Tax=Piloderma croceum (strain F 1598) TaxID=765440 RepID=A0A0C3CJS7_PILCF|nr:hypothetical protein PILCRDRAFT_812786 [Piloderma croceum F 1598]
MRLGQWAVVDLSGRKDGSDARTRFIRELEGCLRNLGMLINPHPTPDVISGSGYAAASLLKSAFDNGAGFILVILPERAEEVRNIVKHTGDIVLGVPTQCVKEDKMVSANNQYCNNLALKINARLGGVNSVPSSSFLDELGKQPFMVFGADASHPGAGVRNQPSIASLVWSTNETATTYAAVSGVQDPGQEMILSLESMLTFALTSFVESSGCPPVRIIFFRDGLSNSQFEEIGAREIEIIAKVIKQHSKFWISRNWPPPLVTFVVVGKRHHIRFFPIDGRGADKKGNVQAGFLAEEGLKSPFNRDYFLQSHGGLLGTSRPSHYTVLKDDCFKKMPHLLQELSFALCHCYASATRSVSIPAPTYYADKVCQRAKFHFTPEGDDSSVSSDTIFDLPYWEHRYKPINRRLAKTMYFV